MVEMDKADGLSLCLDDGEPFGGHAIDIFLSGDTVSPPALVG